MTGSLAWFGPQLNREPLPRMPVRPRGFIGIPPELNMRLHSYECRPESGLALIATLASTSGSAPFASAFRTFELT